jgi:hypothetical protein
MPGGSPHPRPHVQMKKAHELSHHRYAETIRHSLRDGFNGFLRSLPGDRALLPPSPAMMRKHPGLLDTSVGVSERYDFAVRPSCVRLAHDKRPSHPAPNVRDDREAPLLEGAGRPNQCI